MCFFYILLRNNNNWHLYFRNKYLWTAIVFKLASILWCKTKSENRKTTGCGNFLKLRNHLFLRVFLMLLVSVLSILLSNILIYQIIHDSGLLPRLKFLWHPPLVINMGEKAKLWLIPYYCKNKRMKILRH